MNILYGQVLSYQVGRHTEYEIPGQKSEAVLLGDYICGGNTILLVKDLKTKELIHLEPCDVIDFPGIQVAKGVIAGNQLNLGN